MEIVLFFVTTSLLFSKRIFSERIGPSSVCLGYPPDCYEFLKNYAPADYSDVSDVSDSDLLSFISDPDVCTFDKHFYLHPRLNIKSLSTMADGVTQARFPGSLDMAPFGIRWCRLSQQYLIEQFNKNSEDSISILKTRMINLQDDLRAAESSFAGLLTTEYPTRFSALLENATFSFSESFSSLSSNSILIRGAFFLRQFIEHFRLICGVKTVFFEISQSYPHIFEDWQNTLPRVDFHYEIYGRHWDILSELVELSSGQSFTEVGCALGAIGIFLLQKYRGYFSYVGLDPTLKKETIEEFKMRFPGRALIYQNTSLEIAMTVPKETRGVVFIDGPHTYSNVRNDIDYWFDKVVKGGILAGHDFSPQHPPLMWAVLEQAVNRQIKVVNVGMDAVWWWSII